MIAEDFGGFQKIILMKFLYLGEHFSVKVEAVVAADESEAGFSFLDVFESVIVKGFVGDVGEIGYQNKISEDFFGEFQKIIRISED